MAGFLALEFDDVTRVLANAATRGKRVIEKEPVGHWKNSGFFWKAFWVTLSGWKDAADIQEG